MQVSFFLFVSSAYIAILTGTAGNVVEVKLSDSLEEDVS